MSAEFKKSADSVSDFCVVKVGEFSLYSSVFKSMAMDETKLHQTQIATW